MTSKKKTESTSQSQDSKPSPRRTLPVAIVVGILGVIIVVGLAVLWEKRIEPLVGVDLPSEVQETSETSSIVPYICDQDPEACEKAPLTFQGREDAGEAQAPAQEAQGPQDQEDGDEGSSPPLISYPPSAEAPEGEEEGKGHGILETLENLPILRDMKERLGAIDQLNPLQRRVEILSLLAIVENVQAGHVSFDILVRAMKDSDNPDYQAIAQQLQQDGNVVPFSQLKPVSEVTKPKPQMKQEESLWDQVKSWGESVIEIKTTADVEAEDRAEAFKKAARAGLYGKAISLYKDMTQEQQKAYVSWVTEIDKQQQLVALKGILLQHITERF